MCVRGWKGIHCAHGSHYRIPEPGPPLSHKCPARENFGGIPFSKGKRLCFGNTWVRRLGGRARGRGVVTMKPLSPQRMWRRATK